MSTAAPHLPTPDAVLARARHENFPVAGPLLSARHRRHLLALYGFARLVDDVGDDARGDRERLLDELEAQLDRIYGGEEPAHPLMRRLRATVAECRLPDELLRRLIAANRRDQVVHAYATYEDLLGYCELSANPVGRLVLHVFDAATTDRMALSDAVCTGLQLTEHWQDVVEDLRRGRVYVPAEDLARFGCSPADLALAPPPPRVRQLLAFEVERARGLFDDGAPLVATLRGRPRLAVAAFVAGGRAALGALERARFDVSRGAPKAAWSTRAGAMLATLLGAGRR
jgi:squalene synthase HpnC